MNIKPRRKTERLELRLTPKQKAKLKQLATDMNISVTEYIVSVLHLPQTEE